jgi:glycerol-3-phosphate dehydrogenase
MPNAPGRSPTQSTPLAGGEIQDFAALGAAAQRAVGNTVSAPTLKAWLRNYGTDYQALAQLATQAAQAAPIGDSDTVAAELTYAVQNEMALNLSDVILRRTNLGSGAHPGSAALADAAAVLQPLLAWSDAKRREEIAATETLLRDHRASVPASEPRRHAAQSGVLH